MRTGLLPARASLLVSWLCLLHRLYCNRRETACGPGPFRLPSVHEDPVGVRVRRLRGAARPVHECAASEAGRGLQPRARAAPRGHCDDRAAPGGRPRSRRGAACRGGILAHRGRRGRAARVRRVLLRHAGERRARGHPPGSAVREEEPRPHPARELPGRERAGGRGAGPRDREPRADRRPPCRNLHAPRDSRRRELQAGGHCHGPDPLHPRGQDPHRRGGRRGAGPREGRGGARSPRQRPGRRRTSCARRRPRSSVVSCATCPRPTG